MVAPDLVAKLRVLRGIDDQHAGLPVADNDVSQGEGRSSECARPADVGVGRANNLNSDVAIAECAIPVFIEVGFPVPIGIAPAVLVGTDEGKLHEVGIRKINLDARAMVPRYHASGFRPQFLNGRTERKSRRANEVGAGPIGNQYSRALITRHLAISIQPDQVAPHFVVKRQLPLDRDAGPLVA